MNNFLGQGLALFFPEQRIFIGYMLSALILAFISYVIFRRSPEDKRPDLKGGFFSFVFDPQVYGHKSAKQDYWFFLVNAFVFYAIIVQFLIGQQVFYSVSEFLLTKYLGPLKAPLLGSSLGLVLYTLAAAVAIDLGVFVTHYFQHKNPVLWHFHKVHHSAEVLTPITLYRMHPVDLAFTALATSVLGGMAMGLFFYLSGNVPDEYTVFGVNIIFFLFYIFGYNLRHSHIWLSYPRWLSHILISPAQHQIHHSIEPKHMDRNLGLVFALWDWLFGTLYVPKGYEKIEYGISKKEKNPFNSVWELYASPFRWAWKTLRDNKMSRKRFIRLALVVIYIAAISEIIYASTKKYSPPSVNLEELTWTEVKQAQDHGYDAVLIPTGGTEQNGAHMVLGKHNYIVHYTAEKIARKAGNMLVAPVMAYVPEGAIEPVPTFHMPYPGTITLPDDVFEAVLKSAAESFIHHGFHYIFFLGDSYNNQEPQRIAAEQLAKKWAAKGVTVVQLEKYYSANGQFDWLLGKGYTAAQIGGHAGIRDTSELMVVHPQGVRRFPVFATKGELAYAPEGVQGDNGDFTKARKALGEQLLGMKIDAALAEIKAVRKEPTPDKPAVPASKAKSGQ